MAGRPTNRQPIDNASQEAMFQVALQATIAAKDDQIGVLKAQTETQAALIAELRG